LPTIVSALTVISVPAMHKKLVRITVPRLVRRAHPAAG
jgi:hypothetical protein